MLLLFSCEVVSNSLWPYGLQHTSLLSFTFSWSLLKLMSIETVMLSNHLIFCHPLSPFAFSLSQHQGLFQFVSSLHQVAKVWELQLQPQSSNDYSGLIFFMIDWFDLRAVQGIQEPSPAPQFKNINSSVLSFLYGPTLISIHDYWKNFDYTDLC